MYMCNYKYRFFSGYTNYNTISDTRFQKG